MNIWTNEEIEDILIQLNQQKLPFEQYEFAGLGEGLHLLGKGGYALVYEAETRQTHKKKFAIKVIGFGEKHVDSDFFKKSVKVQKALGENRHDVVKVYEYAELLVQMDENGCVTKAELEQRNVLKLQFIVMEIIEPVITMDQLGQPHLLPERLAEFNEDEILKMAFDIGNALTRAHEKNILHRDIKLENIFYSPKEKHYKLGDFGIAKKTDDGMASTVTFTKGYGAPEVVGSLDEKYDSTADIYSFGVMMYVLVNRLKFPDSDNYHVNLTAQYRLGYRLPRPQGGSDALYNIIDRMCRFDPDERYQSMQEVMTELNHLIFGPVVKYKKEHNAATGMMGLLFFLFGGVGCIIAQEQQAYTWIPVTLLSLAFVFFEQYWILKENNPKYIKLYFSTNKFYIWMCAIYVLLALVGLILKYGHSYFLESLFGKKGYDYLCQIDFIKAGLAGAFFWVAWKLREKIMIVKECKLQLK